MRMRLLVGLVFLCAAVASCSGTRAALDAATGSAAIEAESEMSRSSEAATALAEGFPEEVPLVDADIVSSTREDAKKWNVLMNGEGEQSEMMQLACELMSEAGFTEDGIQAETMKQWKSADYKVTLVMGPLDDDPEHLAINYAVTKR